MPEAEDLLIDAARHATVALRRLWRRRRPAPSPEAVVLLADARRRLELLVEAVTGRRIPIRTAQASAPRPLLRRILAPDHASAAPTGPLPASDGFNIYLPPSLPGSAVAADDYCLLAILQALHCERGSAIHPGAHETGPVADLFLLAEAAACVCELRRLLPGWSAALDGLQARTLLAIGVHRPRGQQETAVAALYGAFLRGAGERPPPSPGADASLDWARTWAWNLSRRHRGERYIPWLGDLIIGRLLPPEASPDSRPSDAHKPARQAQPGRSTTLSRRPRARAATQDEDDATPGAWMVHTTEPQPHVEDPLGLNRPTDRMPDDDPEGAASSLSELAQARLIHIPSASREAFCSSDPPPRLAPSLHSETATTGIAYPEWDCHAGTYRERAVRVLPASALKGSAEWGTLTLARHAGLLGEIRRRLGALRPERQLLKAQAEGDEIDCDALVAERCEHRAGFSPPGTFYQRRHPAPRRLGMLLLIDASASTDAWVGGNVRVIDVEKEAALIAAHAFHAARVDFSALAFSGEGPQGVHISGIKGFDDPWNIDCQRRIAGLEPDRYTRLGAALRHGSAVLNARPVDHRLLLLFSDGRPNDCDRYVSEYGVEDARRAVIEARALHIAPYCFTIDRDSSGYLPTIFGPGNYTIVQHPERLPAAFVEWFHRIARHCR